MSDLCGWATVVFVIHCDPRGYTGTPHPLARYMDGSKPRTGLMDPPSKPVGGGVDHITDSIIQPQSQSRGGPGRSWYTSLGHSPETYSDPLFRQHLTSGIQWVLESDSLRGRSGNSSSPGQPPSDSGDAEVGSLSSSPGTNTNTTTTLSSSSGGKHPVSLQLVASVLVFVALSCLT
ncbi:hypothetical protein OC845_006647 [Tilletia horrida]|nr:hypothetical protein OC845_006647 [Tilletia horrida]